MRHNVHPNTQWCACRLPAATLWACIAGVGMRRLPRSFPHRWVSKLIPFLTVVANRRLQVGSALVAKQTFALFQITKRCSILAVLGLKPYSETRLEMLHKLQARIMRICSFGDFKSTGRKID
jgi:hypothetical protein